jgi:nanoRNase/pAp phosphatase (c-di-AMP/oligoRNAs hydrolase)
VLAVGKSILNRASQVNIGELMLAFGGGGHANAGTCQVAHEDAAQVLATVLDRLNGVPAAV